ncbi:transcription cofactor vestigial-like protein 4 isoform X2 [Anabrus simplex]|uniref:transcription cofactor vestigial-like protein 4 isoform X2 n=1 Tax=Anabrus simplex TaxID=316456 RepID=UPI0035A311E1
MDTLPVPRVWRPWISDDARSRPSKELPSGRWRRERRCRYTPHAAAAAEAVSGDTPLDMSTRSRSARGLPPSYNQTVSAPGYRPPARPSVITCAPPAKGHRRELLSGMCDPVIDEHFRRSLGKDYMSVFSNEEHVMDSSVAINNNNEDGDSVTITGLSVDDHFAKALGDTWVKLQTQRSSNTGPTKSQRRGLIST